jgi:peptide/nickel transport system permease protein
VARSGGSLRRYALTRLALVVPMVWVLLTLVFLLMRVAPGDPIQAALGGKLSPAQLAAKRHVAGFDKPLVVQYWEYLRQVVTLHLGHSLTDNTPITTIVKVNGAATLELSVTAMLVAVAIGVPIGLRAGRLRDGAFDAFGRLFGIVTYAAPVFFVGLIFQLVFSKWLNWLPNSGQLSPIDQAELPAHTHLSVVDAIWDHNTSAISDALKHLAMPALTLGLLLCGVVIRLIRTNLIQTLKGDYVEAARARGVPERKVVMRHAFRNALVPVVTVMGLQAALLLSGAVLTEETFNWPGIGNQLVTYLNNRDYVAVQGIITIFALAVVAISLLIDFVNAAIDPRVRY